jgi:thioredoxin reductase
VLVCDSGQYRNWASRAVHGFLTRDGISPEDLRSAARRDLQRYGVDIQPVEVREICRTESGFLVSLDGGTEVEAAKLLLATGVTDELPPIEGARDFYGRGLHHCPYCDAWELADQPLGAYGRGSRGVGLAQSLRTWSDDVSLFTDGHARLDSRTRAELRGLAIRVHEEPIERLEGDGELEFVRMRSGGRVECRGLFFTTGQFLRSPLAQRLGCRLTARGVVRTGRLEDTGVAGVYVAGDASRDVQFVVVAAAEGAKAAIAINTALREEERSARVNATAVDRE